MSDQDVLFNGTLLLTAIFLAKLLLELVQVLITRVEIDNEIRILAGAFAEDFYLNRDQHRTDMRFKMRKRMKERKR